MSLKVLELFGGIGACTAALKRAKIPYSVVDYVEIDKYAVASYNAINDTNFEPQDICTWDKNVDVDLIMHGSPCQDFSVAGNNAGGDKDSGTRSSLMYETIRIVEKLRPKYVIWENVKNILSKRHIHNFEAYLQALKDYGYTNYYQVLNAKDYEIPQNRERVFTISILNNTRFEFPPKQPLKLTLKDLLDNEVDPKYYLADNIVDKYIPTNDNDNTNVMGRLNMDKWQDSMKRIYDITKYAPTINTYQGGYLEPKIIANMIIDDTQGFDGVRLYNDITPTLRAGRSGLKTITNELRIRKLTPKECWRLMGFSDEDFEKAAKVNSNSQLYKQAGNSIVVDVLVGIFNNLLK